MAIGGYGNVATSPIIIGATDETPIGNVTDNLKVYDAAVLNAINTISIGLGLTTASILKQTELSVTTRNEIDLTGVTYTVPNGKTFLLTSFIASYDAQSTLYLRLKKQTGGAGAFATLFRITLEVGGQGQGTTSLNFGHGILVGAATDVFKVTVEASLVKGTVWAGFTGSEL